MSMERTASAYLEQSPEPPGKGLTTPLQPDTIMSGGNGPQAGLQATGQLKLCHCSYRDTLPLVCFQSPLALDAGAEGSPWERAQEERRTSPPWSWALLT